MTQSGRPNLDQNLRFPVGPITTMKQINLAQTINTIANVGVIAGLVFVGLQLKQDRKVAEITSLFDGKKDLLANHCHRWKLRNLSKSLSLGSYFIIRRM